jgi:hypothetical protein
MSTRQERRTRSHVLRITLLLLALLGLALAVRHLLAGDVTQAATPLVLALALTSMAASGHGRRR